MSQLAVIVPVHSDPSRPGRDRLDRLQELVACLDSLVVARSTGAIGRVVERVTLVVVDDGSPQPVAGLLPSAIRDQVRVVRLGRRLGQGAALNRAVEVVPADVYAFTDSDCVVAGNWIEAIDRGAELCGDVIGAAGPPWRHLSAPGRLGRWLTANESLLVETMFSRDLDAFGTTARLDCRNLWLRADAMKPGWFPEDAGAALSGVSSRLVRDRGERLRFDPTLVVHHAPLTSVSGQALTYYRRGATSDLGRHYATDDESLLAAFARTYVRRHFLDPIHAGVHPGYVGLAHGAYWVGLARRRLAGADVRRTNRVGRVRPWRRR